jgi:hypothetical protein
MTNFILENFLWDRHRNVPYAWLQDTENWGKLRKTASYDCHHHHHHHHHQNIQAVSLSSTSKETKLQDQSNISLI